MPDKKFTYKDQTFDLRTWGLSKDYQATATRIGGKMITRLPLTARSWEAAFATIEERLIEILDARYWTWANGMILVGSVRKKRQIDGDIFFIRLALVDQYNSGKPDVVLKLITADRLETAQAMIEQKAFELAKDYGKEIKPCPIPEFIIIP